MSPRGRRHRRLRAVPAACVAQTPVKRVLIIHGGPEVVSGKPRLRRGDAAVAVLAPDDRRRGALGVPGERGIWRTRRTRPCANPSASSSGGVPLDLVIANTAPTLAVRPAASRRALSGRSRRVCRRDGSPGRAAGQGSRRDRHRARTVAGGNDRPGAEAPSGNEASPRGGLRAGRGRIPGARAGDAGPVLEAGDASPTATNRRCPKCWRRSRRCRPTA